MTAAEQARPESVRQRAWRERPEVTGPLEEPDARTGVRLVGADSDEPAYDTGGGADGELTGDWTGDDAGLSAEEAAVHLTDG